MEGAESNEVYERILDKKREGHENAVEEVKKKIFRFSEIGDDKMVELKERVKRSEGEVKVFVHPFYLEYPLKEPRKMQEGFQYTSGILKSREYKIDGIKKSLIDLLRRDKKDTPPVFLFEEEIYTVQMIEILAEEIGENMRNEVMLVQTNFGNGYVGSNENEPKIHERFSDLGAKAFQISGMALSMEFSQDYVHYGQCVSHAIRYLREFAPIQLSGLTYPYDRLDDKKHGGDIPQDPLSNK
ncbi:MAG: hypothetical protein V4438_01255 [Patescibacteria group bacterium]